MSGFVYLVGAGPGDPALFTQGGQRLLNRAEVVVYDAIIPEELLADCPAEKIYVGKRGGRHTLTQEGINDLLVRLGKEGKTVVRLKGGDPFLFGRGGEEALALQSAGVPFAVVPGVSAASAAPAYAGIPITHRRVARGVTIMTGHAAKNDELTLPWESLAGIGHTLVFFMAVQNFSIITHKLMEAGLKASTPAAVIQDGTLPSQKVVTGLVCEIVDKARAAGIRPPSLLVIGEVTALQEQMAWRQSALPLSGKTVVLSRSQNRQHDIVERFRALGAKVFDVPVLTAVARDTEDVTHAVMNLERYDAILFTSTQAGRLFRDKLLTLRKGEAISLPPICAPSPRIARELQREGFLPSLINEPGKSRWMDQLRQQKAGTLRVLHPKAALAGEGFVETQTKIEGLSLVPLALYDQQPLPIEALVKDRIEGGYVDVMILLSGACVDATLKEVPSLLAADRKKPLLAPVGPMAARALTEHGVNPDLLPPDPTLDSLFETVRDHLCERRRC